MSQKNPGAGQTSSVPKMMTDLSVEVVYATPEMQKIIALQVPPGTTMYQAAELSGMPRLFPGLDLASASMGIFGKLEKKPRERMLESGDRVEIYRPLLIDPKEIRRKRAKASKE